MSDATKLTEMPPAIQEVLDRLNTEFGIELCGTPVVLSEADFISCRRYFFKHEGVTTKLKTFLNVEQDQDVHMATSLDHEVLGVDSRLAVLERDLRTELDYWKLDRAKEETVGVVTFHDTTEPSKLTRALYEFLRCRDVHVWYMEAPTVLLDGVTFIAKSQKMGANGRYSAFDTFWRLIKDHPGRVLLREIIEQDLEGTDRKGYCARFALEMKLRPEMLGAKVS